MQQLKQLMLSRTNFISTFKKKKQLFSNDQNVLEQMMHDLLLEKKKMHINEFWQNKITQIIISQKIQSPYKLMQFYQYSKIIMKTYSEHFLSESDHQDIDKMVSKDKKMHSYNQNNIQINTFSSNHQNITPETIIEQKKIQESNDFKLQKHLGSNIQNKKKLVFKIVTLYHDFFQEQKTTTKAEQIMHIYKKKLCDQGIIVPTLFCWLNDWICKQFSSFIKSQISLLSHKKYSKIKKYQKNTQTINADKIQIKSNAQKIIKQQINFQSVVFQSPNRKNERNIKKQVDLDMFFSIDMSSGKSKQELYKKISMIKKKNIQQTNEREIFTNYKSNQNISGPQQQVLLTITGQNQNYQTQRSKQYFKDNRRLSINSYDTSNLITIKKQQLQIIVKKQIVNDEFDAPINRQILIGAFYDKYFNWYKNLQQVLPDLDIQYVKQIKRNDRKAEVKKRIKQISRVLLRNQQSVKNTAQKYELQYFQRKNKQQKRMRRKKRNLKSINNQSINDPETQIRTAYNSLQAMNHKIHTKITSQKKINSNLLMRKQIQQLNNLQRIYHQKKQRPKQIYELNKPIKFEFNLPRLPQKHRNLQSKLKQQSKIVLIQSGRYKLLDTLDSSEVIQMGNKKDKLKNYSVDINSLKYDSPVIERQSYSTKRNSSLNKRSVSIFEIITKKNKNYQVNEKQQHSKKRKSVQTQEITPQTIRQPKRRYRKKKEMEDNQQTRKQFKQIIQSLQTYDYDLISGWEKGQQTPIIKEYQTSIIN